jgi:hypothetical protein
VKKTKTNPDLVSISWLAEEHHHDRDTISRRLRGIPFVLGPKGAKQYDREVAAAAIESRDGDMVSLIHERARKAAIERELRQMQLEEKQRNFLPAEFITTYSTELVVALRSEINNWPCSEGAKQRCFLSIERAGLKLGVLMGAPDIRQREEDLAVRQKQLEKDITAGRIPDHWADVVTPENNKRVWSNELGRYYTRKEIIAKFGPGTPISPIDEFLEEEADEN